MNVINDNIYNRSWKVYPVVMSDNIAAVSSCRVVVSSRRRVVVFPWRPSDINAALTTNQPRNGCPRKITSDVQMLFWVTAICVIVGVLVLNNNYFYIHIILL